jgi:hypothetical protein
MNKIFILLKGFKFFEFNFEQEDNNNPWSAFSGDNDDMGFGEGFDDGDGCTHIEYNAVCFFFENGFGSTFYFGDKNA